jgi:hypothetical protein
MTRSRLIPLFVALALPLMAAGCASIAAVPAGPFQVGENQVSLGRDWSNMSASMPGRSKKVSVLSIDGPLLNRLYVSDALVAGDYIIKPLDKARPTPTVRTGMSATERVEFVIDTVSALDYLHAEAKSLRPAKFRGQNAVRFDLTAQTKEGLDISGTGLVAEVSGKTYVILYLAPGEYYFDAYLPEVEKVMASVAS